MKEETLYITTVEREGQMMNKVIGKKDRNIICLLLYILTNSSDENKIEY